MDGVEGSITPQFPEGSVVEEVKPAAFVYTLLEGDAVKAGVWRATLSATRDHYCCFIHAWILLREPNQQVVAAFTEHQLSRVETPTSTTTTTTQAPTTTTTVIGPLWQVSTEVDPMTDEITYTAVLRSTGPEHILGNGPSLYVICSHVPSSPTLFLVADMPSGLPFDANFDSATGWTTDVLLRFDKEDAQQLVAPVDVTPLWSNFIYFSDDVSRLWADRRWVVKMLGADQLLISGEAHGSDPVDRYDLRGMEQRAAAVLKPCGRKIGSD